MDAWLLSAFVLLVLILIVVGIVWATKLPYRTLGLGDEEVLSVL